MGYQNEPLTMWFDRRLVMRPSPIEGTGTFATDSIRAGETLMWISGGVVYTPEDWQAGRVQLDPDLYNEERLANNILIATPKVFHYYVNHSCDPNAMSASRSASTIYYMAWRDIGPNEEITTDYAISGETNLAVCSCGSAQCRGRVTSHDWQRPDLQQRYRGYFPVQLEQRIQQMNTSV